MLVEPASEDESAQPKAQSEQSGAVQRPIEPPGCFVHIQPVAGEVRCKKRYSQKPCDSLSSLCYVHVAALMTFLHSP